jgi:hypothetical protein
MVSYGQISGERSKGERSKGEISRRTKQRRKKEVMDDAHDVLSALRLGWSVAEMRGRNRPDGPPGELIGMPDHVDHPLPLRIERGKTELRIEIQSVVAELAKELRVDDAPDGTTFSAALGDQAKLLAHVRAAKAADALRQARDILRQDPANQPEALQALTKGLTIQRAVVARRQQVVAGTHATVAALGLEQACCAGEEAGKAALEYVIETLAQQGPQVTAQAIEQHQDQLAAAARQPWDDLAELIWQFDAHVQDRLAALSETQAIGYQLGRGLADTYWALDSTQPQGTTSWSFLLGERRCAELTRLTGRLAAYMGEYTAPAIAGSLEVWRTVVCTPAWMGDATQTSQTLYSQIRRWYELIILEQDPTTLIGPAAVMRNYRTLARVLKLFWPELVATILGLASLVTLLVLVNTGGTAAWAKTLSGVVAAVGLSLAGLTGTLKNSAQALLKRLRQDAYTDLVALAVQTAPPPPDKFALQEAISRRRLTSATPN